MLLRAPAGRAGRAEASAPRGLRTHNCPLSTRFRFPGSASGNCAYRRDRWKQWPHTRLSPRCLLSVFERLRVTTNTPFSMIPCDAPSPAPAALEPPPTEPSTNPSTGSRAAVRSRILERFFQETQAASRTCTQTHSCMHTCTYTRLHTQPRHTCSSFVPQAAGGDTGDPLSATSPWASPGLAGQ